MLQPIEVLVLGGGIDSERAVSLRSMRALCDGLARAEGIVVHERIVEEVTPGLLAGMPGRVIWPMLHGPVGEGGPVQDALLADGRPFVGCGPSSARRAMDKLASKIEAAGAGLATAPACVLRADDPEPPLPFPLVIKPVAEGSTIGLRICRDRGSWDAARDAALGSAKVCMVESLIVGRELTVPMIDARVLEAAFGEPSGSPAPSETMPRRLAALPCIEIIPAEGLYDYEAKYERNDTRYLLATDAPDPARDAALSPAIQRCVRLAEAMGIRHLARVDFILDPHGTPWFLEINTMPGFTDHSLLPMAAAAVGLDMSELGARIVRAALADGAIRR